MFLDVSTRIFFPPTVCKGGGLATCDFIPYISTTSTSRHTAIYNVLPYDAKPKKHTFVSTRYTTAMLEAPRVEPWLYR